MSSEDSRDGTWVRAVGCLSSRYGLRLLGRGAERFLERRGTAIEAFQPLVDGCRLDELGKHFNTHITVQSPLQAGALVDLAGMRTLPWQRWTGA